MPDDRALGVFDSGVGGLTVVRAINDLLPGEAVRYVGDTARSPYGPRPVAEIRRFALEIADHLARTEVKMLVVACNSIEVSAIEDVARAHGLPVVGVIAPGIRAAAGAGVFTVGMLSALSEAALRHGLGAELRLWLMVETADALDLDAMRLAEVRTRAGDHHAVAALQHRDRVPATEGMDALAGEIEVE